MKQPWLSVICFAIIFDGSILISATLRKMAIAKAQADATTPYFMDAPIEMYTYSMGEVCSAKVFPYVLTPEQIQVETQKMMAEMSVTCGAPSEAIEPRSPLYDSSLPIYGSSNGDYQVHCSRNSCNWPEDQAH